MVYHLGTLIHVCRDVCLIATAILSSLKSPSRGYYFYYLITRTDSCHIYLSYIASCKYTLTVYGLCCTYACCAAMPCQQHILQQDQYCFAREAEFSFIFHIYPCSRRELEETQLVTKGTKNGAEKIFNAKGGQRFLDTFHPSDR